MENRQQIVEALNSLKKNSHRNAISKSFYDAAFDVDDILRQEGRDDLADAAAEAFHAQKMLLIVSEVVEAMEARRKGLDTFEEEIADAQIRLADYAGYSNVDMGEEVVRKMEKNAKRSDLHGNNF